MNRALSRFRCALAIVSSALFCLALSPSACGQALLDTEATEIATTVAAPEVGDASPVVADASPPVGDVNELDPGDAQPPAAGKRWALILCGLPGDDEFREQMVEAITGLYSLSPDRLGVSAEHRFVLAGDQEMAEALEPTTGPVEIASTEAAIALADHVRESITPDDSLWVIVIGHTDIQGRAARWNVTGTDPDQKAFAKWFQQIDCREKVFWITTPLSGFYIRNLSGPNSIIISATLADLEVSATDMPYVLADVISDDPDTQKAGDRDADGQTTLLDLYLACCEEIASRYEIENLVCTEHALIDDNGDRRGSELQLRYLPEELGGRPELAKRNRPSSLDGARAATVLLPNLPVAAPPEAEPEEPEAEAEPDAEAEPEPDADAE